MAKIENILQKLENGAETIIDLPTNDENRRLNAAFVSGEIPNFQLVFPPDSWEEKDLVLGISCHITVKYKGTPVSILAELDKIDDARRLSFIAREPIDPESLREYFRVSLNIPVEISYTPGPREVKVNSWKMLGTTINLSGCGVLGMFTEKPPSFKRLQITIYPPESETTIRCSGNVVRTYRLRQKKYQVALHFINVDQALRDTLISYCLQEQRRQLRDNIRLHE